MDGSDAGFRFWGGGVKQKQVRSGAVELDSPSADRCLARGLGNSPTVQYR